MALVNLHVLSLSLGKRFIAWVKRTKGDDIEIIEHAVAISSFCDIKVSNKF